MIEFNFILHPLRSTPYGMALDLAIILAIVCWALSVVTREYSWVDRDYQASTPRLIPFTRIGCIG